MKKNSFVKKQFDMSMMFHQCQRFSFWQINFKTIVIHEKWIRFFLFLNHCVFRIILFKTNNVQKLDDDEQCSKRRKSRSEIKQKKSTIKLWFHDNQNNEIKKKYFEINHLSFDHN